MNPEILEERMQQVALSSGFVMRLRLQSERLTALLVCETARATDLCEVQAYRIRQEKIRERCAAAQMAREMLSLVFPVCFHCIFSR